MFTQMRRSEELGTGLRNIFKYSKAYSGSDNIIVNEEDVFTMEVPLDEKSINVDKTNDLTKREKEILSAIDNNDRITQKELSQKLNISDKNIRNHIAKLKLKGFLQRIGPNKGGYWRIIKQDV